MRTKILLEICGDPACCRLDEATGELSLAERVDREEREVYRLVARASDGTHHTDINLTLLVCNIRSSDNVSKQAIIAEIVCGTRFSYKSKLKSPLQRHFDGCAYSTT